MYESSFQIKAAKLWNKLPSQITSLNNLTAFKEKLNKYLIGYPDRPPVTGYYHVTKNSLLDYTIKNKMWFCFKISKIPLMIAILQYFLCFSKLANGFALLIGKVFLLVKTSVILSSNNWCFLFFHMTMFDKCLVILFLYILPSSFIISSATWLPWILDSVMIGGEHLMFIFYNYCGFFICTGCWLTIECNFCIFFAYAHFVVVSIVFWTNGGWLHGNGLMSVFVSCLALSRSLSLFMQ